VSAGSGVLEWFIVSVYLGGVPNGNSSLPGPGSFWGGRWSIDDVNGELRIHASGRIFYE
jgi:hypothetical protein